MKIQIQQIIQIQRTKANRTPWAQIRHLRPPRLLWSSYSINSEPQSTDSEKPAPSARPEANATETGSPQSETDEAEWAAEYQAVLKLTNAGADNAIASKRENIKDAKAPPKPKRKRKMLTHGVYSDDHVLPWERPADYDELFEDLKKEWQPIGRTEEETVIDITHLMWLKRRAQKMSQLAYQRDPLATTLPDVANLTWPDILTVQRSKGMAVRDAITTTNAVMEGFSAVAESIRKNSHDTGTPSGKQAQQKMFETAHFVTKVVTTLEKKALPMISSWSDVVEELRGTFDQAYHSKLLKKEAETIGVIEARIDKLIYRLIGLQECKRTAASRVSTLPQAKSPAIAAAAPTSSETADAVPTSDAATKE